jgi:hypothetical protein
MPYTFAPPEISRDVFLAQLRAESSPLKRVPQFPLVAESPNLQRKESFALVTDDRCR